MDLIISKQKAKFNTSDHGSTKKLVIVEFPNCISTSSGQSFKWMPTYKQLDDIKRSLDNIEKESWGREDE